MTETSDGPTPDPLAQAADSGSFFGNLFNLFFEPGATFEKIFVKPRVLLVILLQMAIGLGFTTVWLDRMDPREFMRAQIESNPRLQDMPSEQVDRIIDSQASFMKTWGRIGPLIAPIVIDLLLAGLLLFMFRFFLAVDVSFVQSLATVAWSFTAMSLVQTPIIMAVFALKGDWNLDPNSVVQANPTVLFEQADVPGWLWSLLGSFDLFTFWGIFLLATGFAVAGKRELSTGLWGVGIPWAIYVMVKVAFALMFR